MRIGFDAKRAFHNFRGLGNYSRTLIEGLVKYAPQNNYHLFTPDFSDPKFLEFKTHLEGDVQIHTPRNLILKKAHPLWRGALVSREINHLKLDVFHGLSHELPRGLSHSKALKVVTIHDLIVLRYPNFFSWIDRFTYLSKIKHAVNVADVVIAICEQTKRDLVDFLGVGDSKIKVVYQACSPDFYEKISRDEVAHVMKKYSLEREYFFSVGALEERKNLIRLIEAFSKLASKVEANLVIAGHGKNEYVSVLKKKVNELGLDARVIFLGSVVQSDLPALFSGCRAFVYPSLFEGFGLPIVEAMFCGVPVLTSQGSCFPESGGDAALYADPLSIDSIAEKLLLVAQDKDLRDKMIHKGYAQAQKFHLSQTTSELLNVYQNRV